MSNVYIFTVIGSFFLVVPFVLEAKNFTEKQLTLKSKDMPDEQFIFKSDNLEVSSPKNPAQKEKCNIYIDPNCK